MQREDLKLWLWISCMNNEYHIKLRIAHWTAIGDLKFKMSVNGCILSEWDTSLCHFTWMKISSKKWET